VPKRNRLSLTAPHIAPPVEVQPDPSRTPRALSAAALVLATLLLAATYFLISPPRDRDHPGAIPWSPHSLLHPLTRLMSLYSAFPTARGVEIKDISFHVASALGLVLLAARALTLRREGRSLDSKRSDAPAGAAQTTAQVVSAPRPHPVVGGPARMAQLWLASWVVISLLSTFWSGDAALALGQTALYALALGWAVALGNTLAGRDIPRLLGVYVVLASAASALCVWYYYERNPAHRPGFPIGNPSTLAACTLPAILLALGALWAAVLDLRHDRSSSTWFRAGLPLLALLPLGWCLLLTGSRAAWVGTAAGAGAVAFLRAGPRARWLMLALGIVTASAGAWYFTQVRAEDLTMARGATIRFRVYAWRYATQLWAHRTISGNGAGCYPRLVGPLALGDRMLDPAAFMGENVEHAHNELFEVFAEIGLIGGLTFVAGFVATFVAAAGLLRANLSRPRRLLLTGLVAGVAALLGDAFFGVGLRLPGVPAVFYTLLGVLWAACRGIVREATPERAARDRPGWMALASHVGGGWWAGLATAGGVAAAGGAGALALRNAAATRVEYRSEAAARAKDLERADYFARQARDGLLEPARQLLADRRSVECAFALALSDLARWDRARMDSPTPVAPASEAALREGAIAAADRAYHLAEQAERRAPAFGRSTLIQARSAELLAALHAETAPAISGHWRNEAWTAWRRRRLQRPYEPETLLALTRYPATVADHVICLRDALRNGFPGPEWFGSLARLASHPEFEEALRMLLQAVGPYDPRTEIDVLILTLAPEVHRLYAFVLAMHEDYVAAASQAQRAAELYEPMRPRFPEMRAVALAEQSDFVLLSPGRDPLQAVALTRAALDSLPVIQEQKLEELARPFRARLARNLLAAGDEEAAADVLRRLGEVSDTQAELLCAAYLELVQMFVRAPDRRADLRNWVDAALRRVPASVDAWSWKAWLAAEAGGAEAVEATKHQAARAGVRAEEWAEIRRRLCADYPDVCQREEP
jgi:O-antigen ligase